MPKLITSRELTASYTAFEIEAPDIAREARPGQIVLFHTGGLDTPVPYAIADHDTGKGTITIVGRTVVSGIPNGDRVELTGPLGRPAAPGKAGKILCIAEGLGIAALLPRLREFKQKGWYTQVIAGYPSRDAAFWRKRLDEFSDELYVVTDDGSLGIKGPIRYTIRAVCEQTNDIDRVLAVGPLELLKTTADITRKHAIPTWISVNAVFDVNGAAETSATAADASEAAAAVTAESSATDAAAFIGDSRTSGASAGGDAATVASSDQPVPVFDWSEASDFNGHELDFDDLTRKLGIRTTK